MLFAWRPLAFAAIARFSWYTSPTVAAYPSKVDVRYFNGGATQEDQCRLCFPDRK
jgi:hypothetical protein